MGHSTQATPKFPLRNLTPLQLMFPGGQSPNRESSFLISFTVIESSIPDSLIEILFIGRDTLIFEVSNTSSRFSGRRSALLPFSSSAILIMTPPVMARFIFALLISKELRDTFSLAFFKISAYVSSLFRHVTPTAVVRGTFFFKRR